MKRYCTVAVDSSVHALDRPFDYRIPDRMLGALAVGSVVRVPLHGRRIRGYVVDVRDEPAVPRVSQVSALVSPQPLFHAESIELARWAAHRYCAPLGLVLHHATPGRFSAPPADAPPVSGTSAPGGPGWLAGHAGIPEAIRGARTVVVRTPGPSDELETVAFACAHAPGPVLVVCPRTDMAERLAAGLPEAELAHGDMSPARRARAWARARDGQLRILVGGRAVAFAPAPDVGLVVVTGAHDRAHKGERWPRIHALHAGAQRARLAAAALLVTSPAPPLELAGPGASKRLWLEPVRGHGNVRPQVASPRPGPVTPQLLDVVGSAVRSGADAVVYAVRKGLALRVRCSDCGWYPRCTRCATGLTMVQRSGDGQLRCRSCGLAQALETRCPDCRGDDLKGLGWGGERIVDTLRDHGLPVVGVQAGEEVKRPAGPAVLVGTMAVLGALGGQGAGAVCVADLDQMLGLPDFRASERAFQTLWELAGVLCEGGRFLVQTREPEHHVVQAFTRASYRWFADRELPSRKAAGYPPFGSIVRVDMPAADVDGLRSVLRGLDAELVGPLSRPGGRAAALIRAPALTPLLEPLHAFAIGHPDARVDVDPVDTL